ncbi:MAG: hypothetical protein WCA48_10165 [Pseudomonas gingeri]
MIQVEIVSSVRRWALLYLSHEVIKYIVAIRKHGSGNQTKTKDASIHTDATYEYLGRKKHEELWLKELEGGKYVGRERKGGEDGLKRYDNPTTRPKRALEVVRITGGGNCDQLGAIAYALAREKLPKEYFSAWVSPRTVDHTFALIGPMSSTRKIGTGTDSPEQWIVVDAWPLQPRACRFKHYWLYEHADDLQWYAIAQGKGREGGWADVKSSMLAYFDENLKPNVKSITGKYAKGYSEEGHEVEGVNNPWVEDERGVHEYRYIKAGSEAEKKYQKKVLAVKRKREEEEEEEEEEDT